MLRYREIDKPPLTLGTAEFNPKGYAGKECPSIQEIIRIFNLAWEAGINTLDTAKSYNCDHLIEKYASKFWIIQKIRDVSKCGIAYYHYKPLETRQPVIAASVYDKHQLEGLNIAIVPLNISNTEFVNCGVKAHARSIFDRGRLFQKGYTVKDCLSFVERHKPLSLIVGVNSAKELETILKEY